MYDSRIDTYKHIQNVQIFMSSAFINLWQRSQNHDRTKLVTPEVEVFDEYAPKLASTTYGSESYELAREAMKPALDHHYKFNDHHPEYYPSPQGPEIDRLKTSRHELACGTYNDTIINDAVQCMSADLASKESPIRNMNLLAIIEMLCDWKAASIRQNGGDIRRSIEINQRRFGYSDELKAILLNTLDVI